MEINKYLKDARIKKNITQEQLAEEIGVSRQTISSWENGKSYPDIVSIIKLSDLYDISLDKLFKSDDKLIDNLQKNTDIVKSNKSIIFSIFLGIMLFGGIYIIKNFVDLPKIDNLIINVIMVIIFFGGVLFYLFKNLNISLFLNRNTSNKTILKTITGIIFVISLFGIFPLIDLFTNVYWQTMVIRTCVILFLIVLWLFISNKINKC